MRFLNRKRANKAEMTTRQKLVGRPIDSDRDLHRVVVVVVVVIVDVLPEAYS
jgi:hypothetical protein